ncbi:hypothetical protein QBC42DRAFT_219609 [Cladorrhinum samala]|uniref:MHYT domain-containing protein n=1 Tax=Cladorrhinum samala TaxID=585594 RepID=A0AAV9HZ09_9PEZI|nr:hypothetical protein QBC42DRAFT_219609 [Cladorrhinum samala]
MDVAQRDGLAQHVGHIVPIKFDAGIIVLSYFISLIGAMSTLELINRRTSRKGYYNNILLLGAAVTMGGVAIWCMHFVGNRAVTLLDGQPELQIIYSPGVTVASFFVPIVVLFAAFFVVTSTSNARGVSWWRIAVSGALSGGAICGMHYLGNASIKNYRCSYYVGNIVGAVAIAVTASSVALALFFVFRASWTNSWWRRIGCAVVLASAVSGMHWCGAVGTRYRLKHLRTSTDLDGRNTIVIVVTILSVAVCLVIAGTAVYSARVRQAYADKAQKITLAAAVFDQQGRILVTTDGLLPSEEITSKFVQKTQNDVFSTAHPLFHWLFQASRNWTSVTVLLGKMRQHLAELPHQKRNIRAGVSLVDDDGHVIDNCDVVFRELFCLAAAGLADRFSENLTDAGILWDEILATGGPHDSVSIKSASTRDTKAMTKSADDLAEKGINSFRISHGSLLCLVRLVDNPRVISRLEASGFLFADPHQVAPIICSKMQIRTARLEEKLASMKEYARGSMLDPGIHVGLFAVRTQVDLKGFDVLVRRQARNLLPSVKMPLDRLDQANVDFLRRLDGLTAPMVLEHLQRVQEIPARNASFAAFFHDAVRDLRSRIDDPMFEAARLISRVVQVPCRPPIEGSRLLVTASMITFSVAIPIHERIVTPDYKFIPLYFFKTQQLVYENSPHAAAFARSVHRELSPVLNSVADTPSCAYTRTLSAFLPSKLGSRLLRPLSEDRPTKVSMHVSSSRECMALTPANMSVASLSPSRAGESEAAPSTRRSSTELKPAASTTFDRQRAPPPPRPPLPTHSPRKGSQSKGLGFANMGIMISQEVTVDVDVESQRNSVLINPAEDTTDLPHTVTVHQSRQGKGDNANHARRKSIRALTTSTPPMPSEEISTPKRKVGLAQEIELRDANELNIYGGEGYSTTRVEFKKEEAGEGQDTFVDELLAGCFRSHGGMWAKS